MSIRFKLIVASIFAGIGLIMFVISNFFWAGTLAKSDTQYNVLKAGRVMTSQFRDLIADEDYYELKRRLRKYHFYLVVLGQSGKVEFSNYSNYKVGESADIMLLSPDYKELPGHIKLVYPIKSHTIMQSIYFIPKKDILNRLNCSKGPETILAIISTLIILSTFIYLFFLFAIRVYRPLIRLRTSMEAMEKEDFTREISYGGDDEMARLCQSYEDVRLKLADMSEATRSYQEKYHELIASISHDLKTPMSSIKAYSEALIDDVVEDDAEKKDYLKIINRKADQVIKLTRDLLENSLDALGGLKVNIEEVYSEAFVRSVAESVCLEAKNAGIDLLIEKVENKLIGIDRTRMEQVISNIINNAIKYTPAGGTISVEADSFEEYYRIKIHNTGKGIDPGELPFIFDRFYRSKEYEGKKDGTGLGLYIVKALMEKQNGRIEVSSTYDEGTSFYLYVPIV